jgi:DNA-binding XRE family transcriptional regulator
MNAAKARRLKAAGWKVGSTKDFLRLSDQEAALVEVKLCLMDALRQARRKRGISQIDLAKRMGSSQSRIAKIEAGDPSVSLDLILRALVASGASRREIQETLASGYPGGDQCVGRVRPDSVAPYFRFRPPRSSVILLLSS